MLTALILGGGVSLIASKSPDGLNNVALVEGFVTRVQTVFASPFTGYVTPGIPDSTFARASAGTLGTVVAFGALFLLGRRLYSSEKIGNDY